MAVRESAVQALGKLADARAIDPLVAILESGESSSLVATALGKLDEPQVVRPLLEFCAKQRTYETFIGIRVGKGAFDAKAFQDTMAFQALLSFRERAVEPLCEVASDNDEKRRWVAMHALGVLSSAEVRGLGGDKRDLALSTLANALNDGDSDVRDAACRALVRLKLADE